MYLTLSHATGPTDPPLRELTLDQLLAWAAETTPDRVALIAGLPDPAARRQWTYAALFRDVQRTARALRARFQPGERVAVWAPNRPEWVMLEFGCAMAGLVLVTVNPAFRAHELEYVLRQSRSAGVFLVDSFRGNPMLDTVRQVAPNCPELREVIVFGEWDAFLAGGEDPAITLPEVQPGDPVKIQYTSGTTGFPKGALLHHRGLVNNGAHTARPHGHPRRRGLAHYDAAVPHRRLRLLRARRGVGACHAGAGRSLRPRPGARADRHLRRRRDGRRADDADRDDGAPGLRRHRPVDGAGHLLRRLAGARGAGAPHRAAARRPSRSSSARPSARRWRR